MLKRITYGLLVVAAGLVACAEKTPCDDNQALRNGYCWPVDAAITSADVSPAPDDVAATESGASLDTDTTSTSSAFGMSCTASTECVAPTVYCAVQPGQTKGFCTAFGCDKNPGICPAGWGCMDLSSYGMAAHICIPPTGKETAP